MKYNYSLLFHAYVYTCAKVYSAAIRAVYWWPTNVVVIAFESKLYLANQMTDYLVGLLMLVSMIIQVLVHVKLIVHIHCIHVRACKLISLPVCVQVERIKERVEEKEGIPPPQQR